MSEHALNCMNRLGTVPDRLEGFASRHGPAFYGLDASEQTITLRRDPWTVPDEIAFAGGTLVPFRAGTEVSWRVCP